MHRSSTADFITTRYLFFHWPWPLCSPPVPKLYEERYGTPLDRSVNGYNAGVLLLNLDCWRRTNASTEVN